MKYSLRNLMPKRSWFQFSLKTMLLATTLIAGALGAGLAFHSHQQFCWSRAVHYIEELVASGCLDRAFWEADDPNLTAEQRAAVRLDEFNGHFANQWDHARWRPWERLWIDETPPLDSSP